MVDIEPCPWCDGEQVSDEYQRVNGHRYGCVCGASGPFCRTREQALAEWNRIASQRWRQMEIEPCPCGARANTEVEINRGHYVSCSVDGCWIGPTRETPEAAIAAWNHFAGDRWRPVPLPEDRHDVMVHVKPGRGATHWRPLPEPPEPPPIETSGYVEIIGKELIPEPQEGEK